MSDDNLEKNAGVHFETGASQVEELCAQVDECLLLLSHADLFDVASGLSIREGRLTDQQGKWKSKVVLMREVSRHVEKACSDVGAVAASAP